MTQEEKEKLSQTTKVLKHECKKEIKKEKTRNVSGIK